MIDRKGRRRLITLAEGGVVHTHTGVLPHADMIGAPEGTDMKTAGGAAYLVIRPTLADYVLSMGRTATPIYPKDLGAIITYADIYPGATVVEGGTGSGALAMALLRAAGERGKVISYDIRPEFAAKAVQSVHAFASLELAARLETREGNLYEPIEDRNVDRMVLDVPEPWLAVPNAEAALRLGGIFACFLPTTIQLHHIARTLDESDAFGMIEQFEIMFRPWDSGPMTMRPAHRMVAHTGFVTVARRLPAGGRVKGGLPVDGDPLESEAEAADAFRDGVQGDLAEGEPEGR
jgi:tRNA (adenine57-N1/adenine58-N1)-methyltransferase